MDMNTPEVYKPTSEVRESSFHGRFWRFMASHMLYYIGHMVSKVMNVWPCLFLHPYPLYNKIMVKTYKLYPELWGIRK